MRDISFRTLFLFWCICSSIVTSQEFSPSVPPPVVESAAEEKAAKKGASKCDAAVSLPWFPRLWRLESELTDIQCAALSSALPSRLFLAKEGKFEFFDEKVGELEPACRVEPESSQDVATAYNIVKEHGCRFTIKSGGHSQHPGATNAEGGVIFDLVRLDQVTLAADKKSVEIGPGARWLKVYEEMEKEGLVVMGGRVADVGVGGLVLGGESICVRNSCMQDHSAKYWRRRSIILHCSEWVRMRPRPGHRDSLTGRHNSNYQ